MFWPAAHRLKLYRPSELDHANANRTGNHGASNGSTYSAFPLEVFSILSSRWSWISLFILFFWRWSPFFSEIKILIPPLDVMQICLIAEQLSSQLSFFLDTIGFGPIFSCLVLQLQDMASYGFAEGNCAFFITSSHMDFSFILKLLYTHFDHPQHSSVLPRELFDQNYFLST